MGGVVGIIPARAGFTVSKGTRRECTGDHPRSRGVYRPDIPGQAAREGSSPLARGLQAGPAPRAPLCRIIPARAGFTPNKTEGTENEPDHPRSRGVYQPAEGPQPLARGSSPLARGLRAGAARVDQGQGIIPARAGFTPRGPDESRAPADHPRSRGVYTPLIGRLYEDAGSSPLARGLRRIIAGHTGLIGIIPARAGFTALQGPEPRGSPDHPRSRGVYTTPRRSPRGCAGSSPLARGLPANVYPAIKACGIIPARAGFTTSFAGLAAFDRGSSPLARGLQRGRRDLHGQDRIIPARAGFT